MNPRVDYEMTEKNLEEILEACKPVPCMLIGDYAPPSPQENANSAWANLGEKMGFDSETVRPSNKGQRFFKAVPSETETQRQEREHREKEEKRQKEIKELQEDIAKKQNRLDELNVCNRKS